MFLPCCATLLASSSSSTVMQDQLLNILAYAFSAIFLVLWFLRSIGAAMWFYAGSMALVLAWIFLGGPQFIGGVVTGVIANEVTRRLRK